MATVGFDMDLNFKDNDYVIHWGVSDYILFYGQ